MRAQARCTTRNTCCRPGPGARTSEPQYSLWSRLVGKSCSRLNGASLLHGCVAPHSVDRVSNAPENHAGDASSAVYHSVPMTMAHRLMISSVIGSPLHAASQGQPSGASPSLIKPTMCVSAAYCTAADRAFGRRETWGIKPPGGSAASAAATRKRRGRRARSAPAAAAMTAPHACMRARTQSNDSQLQGAQSSAQSGNGSRLRLQQLSCLFRKHMDDRRAATRGACRTRAAGRAPAHA